MVTEHNGVNSEVTEGKTVPPKRYTPKELLKAMVNAGNFVEDKKRRKILNDAEGLGTEATRATILSDLIRKGYLKLEKNRYYPLPIAVKFVENYGDKEFASPDFSAMWEDRLKSLELGKVSDKELYQKATAYVQKEVAVLLSMGGKLSDFSKEAGGSSFPLVGLCPRCGQSVREGPKVFFCEDNSCGFKVFKNSYGASISAKDMKALLSGGSTGEKSLKKKDGSTYKSTLSLDDELEIRPTWLISNSSSSKKVKLGANCPWCGGKLIQAGGAFMCENYTSKACTLSIPNHLLGASISSNDAIALAAGKAVRKEFMTKGGRKRCRLSWGKKGPIWDWE